MAIFLPPCLRLRISGTVTFCGFIGPPLSGKQRALWTGVQRALHASPVAAVVDAVTLAVRRIGGTRPRKPSGEFASATPSRSDRIQAAFALNWALSGLLQYCSKIL